MRIQILCGVAKLLFNNFLFASPLLPSLRDFSWLVAETTSWQISESQFGGMKD